MNTNKNYGFRSNAIKYHAIFILLAVLALTAACRQPLAASGDKAAPPAQSEKLAQLLKTFDYDHSAPLNAEEKFMIKSGGYSQYHVLFNSTNGQRVPAYMFVPTKPKAPFPCIIVQHGYGMDKSMGTSFASMFVPYGFAVVAIDIQYHGERKQEGKDILSTDVDDDNAALHQTVVDLMRTADYLKSRGDIDMDRIGYIGVSLGSFLGSIFTGVDKRVKSVVLVVGGGGWDKMIASSQVGSFTPLRQFYKDKGQTYDDYDKRMDSVEPLNYIGLVSPRQLYMINCSNDKFVPKPTAEALYAEARDPKKIEWYTCPGDAAHIPPMDKVLGKARTFFKQTLGK